MHAKKLCVLGGLCVLIDLFASRTSSACSLLLE